MTTSPDKLLSLARESGGAVHDMGRGLYAVTFGEVSLPEFVERIRQEEREQCALLISSGKYCRYVEHAQGCCDCGNMAAAIRSISTTESKDDTH
jgi:hypothetical protein